MSGAYQLVIRAMTLAGLGYISYEVYDSYKKEKRMKKLQALKQYQISTGKEVDPKIDKEINEYLDSHYGQKVLERMGSHNVLEEQIRMQIQHKKDLKEKYLATPGGEEQIKKIEDDIKRLDTLYQQVKSSKALDTNDYGAAK